MYTCIHTTICLPSIWKTIRTGYSPLLRYRWLWGGSGVLPLKCWCFNMRMDIVRLVEVGSVVVNFLTICQWAWYISHMVIPRFWSGFWSINSMYIIWLCLREEVVRAHTESSSHQAPKRKKTFCHQTSELYESKCYPKTDGLQRQEEGVTSAMRKTMSADLNLNFVITFSVWHWPARLQSFSLSWFPEWHKLFCLGWGWLIIQKVIVPKLLNESVPWTFPNWADFFRFGELYVYIYTRLCMIHISLP